jgi:uncharacterized protein YabN with tetrapyrrole methylase and pyrophosphatase domain
VRAKVAEEMGELDEALRSGRRERISAELGDLLFTLSNLARWVQTPAEDALRGAIARFESRFRYLEAKLAERGLRASEVNAEELDRLWTEAKQQPNEAPPSPTPTS